MSEITRESHYVPQATLRRWSQDGVSVQVYRLLVSHHNVPEWQLHPIRGLTKQRDLYTTFEGDQEGDDFEKFITREIEEPGQAAVEKLVANSKMKPAEWHSIARFVAAQQMRTPLFFVEWVKRLNESIPETLQSILDELGQRSPAELIEADPEADTANYLQDKLRVTIDPVPGSGNVALVKAQVSSSRTAWLRFMRRMLTERIELFYKHRWRVMKLAGDAEWPMTDHPVLTLNYYSPGKYDFSAGWGREGSEFILPVSPRLAVGTQVGRKETGPWHATTAQTVELQRLVVERALRWIIMRNPEAWITALRPRVVDAQAFITEQESWKTWNAMHVDSEAEFNARRVPPTS
jgi:hypothetical protein